MSSRTSSDEHVQFLLSCIRHSNSGKIDFIEVARECSIVSKGAASKRYERLLKSHNINPHNSLGGPSSSSPTKGENNSNSANNNNKTSPSKRKPSTRKVKDNEPSGSGPVRKKSKMITTNSPNQSNGRKNINSKQKMSVAENGNEDDETAPGLGVRRGVRDNNTTTATNNTTTTTATGTGGSSSSMTMDRGFFSEAMFGRDGDNTNSEDDDDDDDYETDINGEAGKEDELLWDVA